MNEPYDPGAADDERRPSQHVTKKDFRMLGVLLLVLLVLLWPVYMYMLGGVQKSQCTKNLKKIGSAILQYASDFDDHMPFAYQRAGFNSTDVAVHNGQAYTWHWLLQPYVGDWSVFKCPAARPEEHSRSADPDSGQTQISDYGMLDAYSGAGLATISSPGQKIVIGETANHGARGTYDPLPLQADDGFTIGFDNGQVYPDKATQFATRLAFPDTAKGNFSRESDSRHPGGIHFWFADNHIALQDGAAARVILLGGAFGPWDVPRPPKLLGR